MKAAWVLSTLLLSFVAADNHSTDTNSTGGLDGGAIAGIIIGVLAAVGLIGAGVWYFFLKEGAMYAAKTTAGGAATTSSRIDSNHLPMMAMRVNGEEDL
jgi:hypothetical protein